MNYQLDALLTLFKMQRSFEDATQGKESQFVPFSPQSMRLLLAAQPSDMPREVIAMKSADELDKVADYVENLQKTDSLPESGTQRSQALFRMGNHYCLFDFEVNSTGKVTALGFDSGNDTAAALILNYLEAKKIPTTLVVGHRQTIETLQTDHMSCALFSQQHAKTASKFADLHQIHPKQSNVIYWEDMPLDFSRHAQRSIQTLEAFSEKSKNTSGMSPQQFCESLHTETVKHSKKNEQGEVITRQFASNTSLFREEFTDVQHSMLNYLRDTPIATLTRVAENNKPFPAEVLKQQMREQYSTLDPHKGFSEMSDNAKLHFYNHMVAIIEQRSPREIEYHEQCKQLDDSCRQKNDLGDLVVDEELTEGFAKFLEENDYHDYAETVKMYQNDDLEDLNQLRYEEMEALFEDQSPKDIAQLNEFLLENATEHYKIMQPYFETKFQNSPTQSTPG